MYMSILHQPEFALKLTTCCGCDACSMDSWHPRTNDTGLRPTRRSKDGARSMPALRSAAQEVVLARHFSQELHELVALPSGQWGKHPLLGALGMILDRLQNRKALGGNFVERRSPILFGCASRHKGAVLQILDDDRDRCPIERRNTAKRRFVERTVRRQRSQAYILRRRQVNGLTLVEKNRDRDLVTSAQEMPWHFQQFLDRFRSWFQNYRQEASPEDCPPTTGARHACFPANRASQLGLSRWPVLLVNRMTRLWAALCEINGLQSLRGLRMALDTSRIRYSWPT